ncbi:MAG: hypothetical protein ACI3XI_06820 [Eubacteriales bacterium]
MENTRFENLKKYPAPALPREIDAGEWQNGHIQGIAVDTEKKYIYYSYTTIFVKADLQGNVIGTVKGLTGHLGCLSFNGGDGCVWGSIEYKHDSIGKSIMNRTGVKLAEEDAFYVAIFDVDKIDRMDMDAEKDGIMTAVYLPDVVEDFAAKGCQGRDHRFACSGIDGTGFGPRFGERAVSPYMLYVAYGVYGDTDRDDNDNQVILEYDWRKLKPLARPLNQSAPHHSGARCENKFFFYTGNTNWGIQNLEYDTYLDAWLVAVYKGKKEKFRNPPMFIIDRQVAPVTEELKGLEGLEGPVLTGAPIGTPDPATGVYGVDFKKGQTGLIALGGGYYYFSYEKTVERDGAKYNASTIRLCRYTGEGEMFETVK